MRRITNTHFVWPLISFISTTILVYKTSTFPNFDSQRNKEDTINDVAKLRNESVIFIGGFPRSGTTLMRAMLDAHPDVRCGEETRILPKVLSLVDSSKSDKRLTEAGVTTDLLDDALIAFVSEIIVKHDEPAKRYCNKDPFVMAMAAYVSQLYKKSKFIFMIRDGRATINSVINRKVTITGYNLTNFEQCLSKWNEYVNNMWKQCLAVGKSRCLPIWYEMLVQNPQKIGAKILKFLELPWNDSILHHSDAVGKPGGIKLSKFEHSTDQVQKPIYLSALKEFVGKVPENVERNIANISPMIDFLGYDTSPDPDYTKIRIPAEYRQFYETDSDLKHSIWPT